MAGIEFFERELKLATADLEPEKINALLAQFARQELAKEISSGRASPQYEKFVNGRQGAAEESVKAPGPIVYVFTNWPLVIEAAIEELKRRAPRKSGRYANSFVVVANQRPVTDFASIPASAECIIFNRQPYTRKLETVQAGAGQRMFDTLLAMRRRFKDAFKFEQKFLDIRGGVAPGVPYILKTTRSRRRDRQAGQPISYPALVINAL